MSAKPHLANSGRSGIQLSAEQGMPSRGRAFWRDALEPYTKPDRRRSLGCVRTALVPYVALFVLMVLSLRISYLLTVALAIPAAGFLVRTYIVFHDCAHGSFLASRRANRWLGAALGLLVFTPFECWKHHHAVHHATAGDLDRRGVGDLPALTVAEYEARHGGPLYTSAPDRCCHDRKIVPLRRAIAGYDAWLSAIRADQSSHRAQASVDDIREDIL